MKIWVDFFVINKSSVVVNVIGRSRGTESTPPPEVVVDLWLGPLALVWVGRRLFFLNCVLIVNF